MLRADRPAPRARAVRRLAATGRGADGDQPGDATAGAAERRGRYARRSARARDEPLDQLISRERAERLWAALGRLKTLDREALDAFYIRGHSLIEIAEMLDVPLGTVKRRLHTAAEAVEASSSKPRSPTPRNGPTDRCRILRRRARSSN